MTPSWTDLPGHRHWLETEAARLLSFAAAARHPVGGFAWLDAEGRPEPERGVRAWITCRMTHVFALAHLRGVPGAGPLADHGVRALRTVLRDPEHGGWYSALDAEGRPAEDGKNAYDHAFVLLSASSAAAAGRPGARELLDDVIAVIEERFWREAEGRCLESWDRAWSGTEDYRGANSNMHLVEAFLAAADATGDPVWLERALRMAGFFIDEAARGHGWRLPEHYSADWEPRLDYNSGERAHPFRPYGATVGHALEWARLLLHLESGLTDPPGWLLEGAEAMFGTAVATGWHADGADGFVYTLDWDDTPVVRERMHWVIAEAVAAAAVLHRRTGRPRYEELYRLWWDHAARFFIDPGAGGWHHELDPANRPAATVWDGKPDVYHAYQAVLLPTLPLRPGLAGALAHAAGQELPFRS
ncbi:mannose/cellobiose epimerase-like protein (N-acyl-D-glucosamine 2-epimerase family) [Spinactinospora alkalitolerans]|uniref:Mannose/cellobiose epimerase-like protein (N-acyl-D-glucosamine 2-epimerase family) n=1 Tax=Spinactinospora alkalitolerans TaxID=687207 RepID=A0A852TRC6_9ACTN|nr:AGE family epimerase/isomerase [Spinactinospora alkalitolerans]NYE46946.1 mannose/cellobiose epimerase-like protein (N-acyl-D-glucosamine 2-epimerase family) [Spinactinospora alkalitolerans]